MNKILLLVVAMLVTTAGANAQSKTVLFDFNKAGELTFTPKTLKDCIKDEVDNGTKMTPILSTSGNNFQMLIIPNEVISLDGVNIKMDRNTGAFSRMGFSLKKGCTATAYDNMTEEILLTNYIGDLRWYKGNKFAIEAPEGYRIDQIEMESTYEGCTDRVCGSTKVVSEGGTQMFSADLRTNTWIANGGSDVKVVNYEPDADAPTQIVYTIKVSLETSQSAITEIGAEDEAPEYFTLTGVKVAPSNLIPGFYIRKTASKATKIKI